MEEVEQELLNGTTTVPTSFEVQTVEGTPTRNGQVVLADEVDYSLSIPVPSEYEEVTEYGRDLEQVQTKKRQYVDQIATLLELDEHDWHYPEHRPSEGSDEKPVQFREIDEGDTETGG